MLQAINGLCDIPVFSLGILFTLMMAPWRLFVLGEKWAKKDTLGARRRVVLKQFGSAFLDFWTIILTSPVLFTLYRFPLMIKKVYNKVRFTLKNQSTYDFLGQSL